MHPIFGQHQLVCAGWLCRSRNPLGMSLGPLSFGNTMEYPWIVIYRFLCAIHGPPHPPDIPWQHEKDIETWFSILVQDRFFLPYVFYFFLAWLRVVVSWRRLPKLAERVPRTAEPGLAALQEFHPIARAGNDLGSCTFYGGFHKWPPPKCMVSNGE